MTRKQILISAGEASGDLHAANLVRAYAARGGEAGFFGMGGPRLAGAGVELLVDCRELGFIGFVDVVIHYRKILRELDRLRDALAARRPDLLVLVDYPGFNMKLAHCAKGLGIPVLYYISPQIWAWRPHRIHEIAAVVDLMAVLFPFEVDLYRRAGVPVRFVGHPLVDEVVPGRARGEIREQLGIDPGRPCVGLLPGSRPGEVSRILPILAAAAQRLEDDIGPLTCLLPLAPTLDHGPLERITARSRTSIRIVEGRTYDALECCDAVATSSGTATLETALLGVPMTIVYRVGRLNYYLMKRLLTVDDIGLVNIVAGRRVVSEFVQNDARPQAVAAELRRLLKDADYASRMRADLAEVARRLGDGGASANAAALVGEMLNE